MATGQRCISLSKIMAAFSLIVLLSACSQGPESAAAEPKGNAMPVSEQVKPDTVSKPPVDLEAPAEYATATFGLG